MLAERKQNLGSGVFGQYELEERKAFQRLQHDGAGCGLINEPFSFDDPALEMATFLSSCLYARLNVVNSDERGGKEYRRQPSEGSFVLEWGSLP